MTAVGIAWARLIFFLTCLIISGLPWLLSGEQINKVDVFGDMLSVISIFAGVLLAILGIFANQPPNISLKAAILLKDANEGKIERLILLLRIYFVAIIFIICAKALQSGGVFSEECLLILKKIALCFGSFSIIVSLGLTSSIASAFGKN